MGFVISSSTVQLYAYLTQYARERIFNGDVNEFQVKYFSLHDDDVDYKITSKLDGNTNQPLTSGFIPDITGDPDSCIKSISTNIFKKNMLTGTTGTIINPPNQQGRTLSIGFNDSSYVDPILLVGKTYSHPFAVNLKALFGDTFGGPTLEEAQGTSFKIDVIDFTDSAYVENITINPSNPLTFNIGDTISCNLGFRKIQSPNTNDVRPFQKNITIKLKITPLQNNRIIETGKDIFTYVKTIAWN